jgi:ubiquinone/menaquinone biosynthesis C-methylase UbiE
MTGSLSLFLERVRNRQVAKLIQDGQSVLDIGCGRAPLLATLHRAGKRRVSYFGVDRIADCIEANRAQHPGQRFRLVELDDASDLRVDETFDVVTMIAVIEHLRDPEAVLRRAGELLNGGGRLIVTAPRRGAEKLHAFGARLGACSKEAYEEHADVFPDRPFFQNLADACELQLRTYERFLLGLNQLAVFSRADSAAGARRRS